MVGIFLYNVGMKVVYGVLLLVVIILAGNWWYGSIGLVCKVPVAYAVGTFDERFGITRSEANRALADAEAVWEQALGRDVFVYDENSKLKVNFVYDERQRQVEAADQAKNNLDSRSEANQVLVELHKKLVSEYRSYEATYEKRRVAYEAALSAYDQEVERYNASGGAPPDAYASLEARRAELDRERQEINTLGEELNDLVDRINEIGDKGNELIGEYNEQVMTFNDTFVGEEEFTQGDYRGRQINIYTFNDHRELVLVLAHEFGHALSLDHVENERSIMYYLMGRQNDPPSLTAEDRAAFERSCADDGLSGFFSPLVLMYNSVIN